MRIELYDTHFEHQGLLSTHFFHPPSSETEGTDYDEAMSHSLDNLESWPTFKLIHLKRDDVNDVGQLVCFPSAD